MNLTHTERERLAYMAGTPLFQTAEEADEAADALEFMEVATNWQYSQTPADLESNLQELNDLQSALPDNCSDAGDLRLWADDVDKICTERDELREAFEVLADAFEAHKGPIKAAQRRALVDTLRGVINGAGFCIRNAVDADLS